MKAKLKAIVASVFAAFSTPDAVKAEKSALAFVIIRVVIGVGGTAASADLVVRILNSFGV